MQKKISNILRMLLFLTNAKKMIILLIYRTVVIFETKYFRHLYEQNSIEWRCSSSKLMQICKVMASMQWWKCYSFWLWAQHYIFFCENPSIVILHTNYYAVNSCFRTIRLATIQYPKWEWTKNTQCENENKKLIDFIEILCILTKSMYVNNCCMIQTLPFQ